MRLSQGILLIIAPAHQCCLKNGQLLLENYLLQQFHTNPAQQGHKILATLLVSQSVSVWRTLFASFHYRLAYHHLVVITLNIYKHQKGIDAKSELSKITNITKQPNSAKEKGIMVIRKPAN